MVQMTARRPAAFDPYKAIEWRDVRLCDIALTHSSAANEKQRESNERLEFLGDSVLDLLCGELLMVRHPAWSPGRLSTARAKLVCRAAVAFRARQIRLGDWIALGNGAEIDGLRSSDKVLGDALEALIGAAYLDGGGDAGMLRARTMATRTGLLP